MLFGILWDCFIYGIEIALFITLGCWLVRLMARVFRWTTSAVNDTVDEFKIPDRKRNKRKEARQS